MYMMMKNAIITRAARYMKGDWPKTAVYAGSVKPVQNVAPVTNFVLYDAFH